MVEDFTSPLFDKWFRKMRRLKRALGEDFREKSGFGGKLHRLNNQFFNNQSRKFLDFKDLAEDCLKSLIFSLLYFEQKKCLVPWYMNIKYASFKIMTHKTSKPWCLCYTCYIHNIMLKIYLLLPPAPPHKIPTLSIGGLIDCLELSPAETHWFLISLISCASDIDLFLKALP